MHFSSKISMAGLILASSAVFSANPAEGLYAGVMGGGSYMPSITFSTLNFDSNYYQSSGKLTYDGGGTAGVQIGTRIEQFRVEGEVNYTTNNMKTLKTNGITIRQDSHNPGLNLKGKTYFIAGLINGFYEPLAYENDGNWTPYIGLGLGYAKVKNTLSFYYATTQFANGNDSASAPIAQGILGVSWFFDDVIAFSIDGRYMTTKKITALDERLTAGTINLVLNVAFDQSDA
ncbi:outer membrane protein [Legionella dresdenensis]|uniref:Outer membrane protein n=1 Tax=Legionella dresdenensis TaxID=450200 RepID=A0ABV8CBX4_9GAMM